MEKEEELLLPAGARGSWHFCRLVTLHAGIFQREPWGGIEAPPQGADGRFGRRAKPTSAQARHKPDLRAGAHIKKTAGELVSAKEAPTISRKDRDKGQGLGY